VARRRENPDGPDTLREMLASPGVEVLRLRPVAPFRDVRGHALWRPGGERLVVFAFDLPPLTPDAQYRVTAQSGEGEAARSTLVANSSGDATISLTLRPPPTQLDSLEILLYPPGRPILAWHNPEATTP
jgi:hypothetical protein